MLDKIFSCLSMTDTILSAMELSDSELLVLT